MQTAHRSAVVESPPITRQRQHFVGEFMVSLVLGALKGDLNKSLI